MERQYCIQLTFYSGFDEISLWWNPPAFSFTSAPRAIIGYSELVTELHQAEQHARANLGQVRFHLYHHDLEFGFQPGTVLRPRAEMQNVMQQGGKPA